MATVEPVHVLPEKINLHTVIGEVEIALQAMDAGSRVFDFSAVRQLDSTVLALMLTCRRAAQQRHIALRFINLPDNLISLARLYGVDQFVAIEVM